MDNKLKNEKSGEALGGRIRSRRKVLGWSQSELAEKIEVSTNTINRFEGGHRVPDARLIIRLGEVLECDLAWLIAGTNGIHTLEAAGIPLYDDWDHDQDNGRVYGNLNHPDFSDGDFGVRITGQAMAPLFTDEDIVIVQKAECHPGTLVCAVDEYGAFQVRWLREKDGNWWLVPENSIYPAIEARRAAILGNVIGSIRSHRF